MWISRDKSYDDGVWLWTCKPELTANGYFICPVDHPDELVGRTSLELLAALRPDLKDKLPAPGQVIEVPEPPNHEALIRRLVDLLRQFRAREVELHSARRQPYSVDDVLVGFADDVLAEAAKLGFTDKPASPADKKEDSHA